MNFLRMFMVCNTEEDEDIEIEGRDSRGETGKACFVIMDFASNPSPYLCDPCLFISVVEVPCLPCLVWLRLKPQCGLTK